MHWASFRWAPLGRESPPHCLDRPPFFLDWTLPPSPLPPCEHLAREGKCPNPAWCCKSCGNCSAACLGPPNFHAPVLGPRLRLYGSLGSRLHGDEGSVTAVLWVQHTNATWLAQNASVPAAERPPIRTVHGVEIWLAMAAGQYEARWFNTSTGKVFAHGETACGDSGCKVAVPGFSGDVAGVLRLLAAPDKLSA